MTKKQVIIKIKHLDLIYLQSMVLYEISPNALRSNIDLNKSKLGPHIDSVIGSMENSFSNQIEN